MLSFFKKNHIRLSKKQYLKRKLSAYPANILLVGQPGSGTQMWLKYNLLHSQDNAIIILDSHQEYDDIFQKKEKKKYHIHKIHIDKLSQYTKSEENRMIQWLQSLLTKKKQIISVELSDSLDGKQVLFVQKCIEYLMNDTEWKHPYVQLYIVPEKANGILPALTKRARVGNMGVVSCFLNSELFDEDYYNQVAMSSNAIIYMGCMNDKVNDWIQRMVGGNLKLKDGESLKTFPYDEELIFKEGIVIRDKKFVFKQDVVDDVLN